MAPGLDNGVNGAEAPCEDGVISTDDAGLDVGIKRARPPSDDGITSTDDASVKRAKSDGADKREVASAESQMEEATSAEQSSFDQKLINAIISCNLPPHFVQDRRVQELFHHLSPTLRLMDRDTVSAQTSELRKDLQRKLRGRIKNAKTSLHITSCAWTSTDPACSIRVTLISWIDTDFRWNSFLADVKYNRYSRQAPFLWHDLKDMMSYNDIHGEIGSVTSNYGPKGYYWITQGKERNACSQDNILGMLHKSKSCMRTAPTDPFHLSSIHTVFHLAAHAAITSNKWDNSSEWNPEGSFLLVPDDSDRQEDQLEREAQMLRVSLRQRQRPIDLNLLKEGEAESDGGMTLTEANAMPLLAKVRAITKKAGVSSRCRALMATCINLNCGNSRYSRLLVPKQGRWESYLLAISYLIELRKAVEAFIISEQERFRQLPLAAAFKTSCIPSLSDEEWTALKWMQRLFTILNYLAKASEGRITLQSALASLHGAMRLLDLQGLQGPTTDLHGCPATLMKAARDKIREQFERFAKSDAACLSYVLKPDRRMHSLRNLLHEIQFNSWGPGRYIDIEKCFRRYLQIKGQQQSKGDEACGDDSNPARKENVTVCFSDSPALAKLMDVEGARLSTEREELSTNTALREGLAWLQDETICPPTPQEIEDPLLYWRNHATKFPQLAELARAVFGATGNTADAETALRAVRSEVSRLLLAEEERNTKTSTIEERVLTSFWIRSGVDQAKDGEPVTFSARSGKQH